MSGGNSVQDINGYRIHTFTTVGTSTFTPARAGNVEVLVIAGGGSGGVRHAGGGGAGGYVYNTALSVSGPVTVTVGDGGAARTSGSGNGNSGANSVFGGLTAIGGGYGSQGEASGSGGSSGGVWSTFARGTAFQGFQGGIGSNGGEEYQYQGGGGGGAGAVGQAGGGGSNYKAGDGGAGLPFSISGTSTYYMGGGGGSTVTNMSLALPGLGGLGGGGKGGGYNSTTSLPGTPNTGGGGGAGGFDGGTNYPSGKGGSGIVIVRYAIVAPRSDCQLAISNPLVYKGTAAVNYGSGSGVSNRELQGTATITYGGAPTSNTALSLPGTSGNVMNLGPFFPSRADPSTSNIFVEAWIYLNSATNGFVFTVSDSGSEDMGFLVNYASTTQFRVCNTGGTIINSTNNVLATATWYHVAGSFDRTNNRVYGFVNGVVGTAGVFSGTARARSSSNMTIGAGNSGTFLPLSAYIRDFRMVQGGIVPTTSFTPAQALFRLNVPSYVTGGSTALSLAEQYFTPSWVNFPGPTGNYLNLNPTPAIFDLATDNMFVECWYYAKGNGGGGAGNLHQILAGGGPVINVDQMWGLYLFFTPNNSVGFYVNNNAGGSTTATLSATLTYNTWYHVAVSWNSSTKAMYVFLNGSASALTTFSGTNRAYSSSYGVYVGADFDRNTSNGYIQDVRIVRGGTVPTTSFTPDAAPFVNIATPSSLFGQLPLAAQNVAVGAFSLRAVNGTTAKAVEVRTLGTFPPQAMTGPSTSFTVGPSGTYTASASTQYGGIEVAWSAFNKVAGDRWTPNTDNYQGAGGAYSGSVTTTDSAPNTYPGEWLQIQIPSGITLTSYSIGAFDTARSPKTFRVFGSADGTVWTLLDSQTNITSWTAGQYNTFNLISTPSSYNYFRIVTASIGSGFWLSIGEWVLTGSCTQDFYADLSGNLSVLGTGQSLASWLAAGTGFVRTWYDQSGAGNHAVQTNTANQPIIQRGSRGPGYMCLYSGSQGLTFGAYNLLNNTNYTTCGVVRRTSTIGNNYYLCGQDGVNNTDQKFHSGYRSSTQLALAHYSDDTDLTVPAFLASSTEPMAYNYLMIGTGRSGRLYSYSSGALYSTTRTYAAYLNHAVGTSFSIGNGYSTFTGEIYEILVFTNSLYDLDNTGGLITQVYNNQVSMYGPYVSGGTTVLSLATQYYQTSMRLASAGTIQLTNRPILTPVLTGLVGAPSFQVGSSVTIYQTAVQPANGITWSFSPTGAGLSIASLSDYALTLVASSSVIPRTYTVTATNKNSLTTITQFTTTVFGQLSSAAAASAVGVYSLRSLISLYARVAQIRSETAYPPTMTSPTTSGYIANASSTFPSTNSISYTGSIGTVNLSPGTYTFQLAGGRGGENLASAAWKTGGLGMIMSAVFTLTTTTTIRYAVGGLGPNGADGGSGGGATYIYDVTNSRALFVAGGGGGHGQSTGGGNAVTSASPGTGAGGTIIYASGGGGGGGIFGDGTNGNSGGGKSFLVSVSPVGTGGSAGGGGPFSSGAFGGGGAAAANSGGGGGGYTGGNQNNTPNGGLGGTSYAIAGSSGLTESITNTAAGYINIISFSVGAGALRAFDNNATTFWENFSGTAVSNGYSTTGTYVGTVSSGGAFYTTTGTAGTYNGEWLEIQVPTGIVLQNYSIQARSGQESSRSPNTFVILGSNDGTTWTLIDTRSGVAAATYASQAVVYFTIASPGATTYTYFRMVVQNVQNTGSIQTVNIAQWSLNYPIADFYADTLGSLTTQTGGSGQTLVNWLGGSRGYVATLYDQSVNGYNLSQPTLNLQPEINLTTTPYSMIFDGSNRWIYNASFPLNMGAASFTFRYVVSNNTGGNILYKAIGSSFSWSYGEKSFWLGNGSNTEGARGNFPAFVGNGQNFVVSANAITASVKNSVVHKANATNSVPIYVNGVQASLGNNSINMVNDPGNFLIIGRGGANSNYIGNMFEIELFSTRLSDTDRLALEN